MEGEGLRDVQVWDGVDQPNAPVGARRGEAGVDGIHEGEQSCGGDRGTMYGGQIYD